MQYHSQTQEGERVQTPEISNIFRLGNYIKGLQQNIFQWKIEGGSREPLGRMYGECLSCTNKSEMAQREHYFVEINKIENFFWRMEDPKEENKS